MYVRAGVFESFGGDSDKGGMMESWNARRYAMVH